MPEFNYLARGEGGRVQRGHMVSESATALRAALESRGERLVSVKPIESNRVFGVTGFDNPLHRLPPRGVTVELALQQMAVMLSSGLGLLQALQTVADQTSSPAMKKVALQLCESIQEGESLSGAMAMHSCFPPITVQLVCVGEASGNLDAVLDRAAAQMGSRRENISSVRTAVAYPAFVGIAAIVVAGYLVLFVIPELEKFLSSIGRRLPAITQSLLDLSVAIRGNGPIVFLIVLVVVIAMVLAYRWPPGRAWFDKWVLRIPVMGTVLRLAGTVTFANSLGVMISSGVTVLEALRTVEGLQGNTYLAGRVADAREQIIEGGNLSDGLRGTSREEPGREEVNRRPAKAAFMPMLPSMIGVAENTGQMDKVLVQVTLFHEAQLRAAIKKLSALIEPLTIVVVGGIVGYVYLAFFMALFAAGG
ncbi:MAG: type II secretion system F family protein [Rubripirellula sp.]|nr:type II secretion system F family protein [Rubripirellula sp.]